MASQPEYDGDTPEGNVDAHEWEKIVNEPLAGYGPKWKFACGFKLDFDGPLIQVSSRFYPPHPHDPNWTGVASLILGSNTTIAEKYFDCETRIELVREVHAWLSKMTYGVEAALTPNLLMED